MSLKTSLFNKAIFLSDIKRYWWLCLANTLLIILCCVVPVYDTCVNHPFYSYGAKPTWMGLGIVINIVFALGTCTILLSYMHFNSSVSTMHSLPIKRSAIYVTKMLTALLFIIVPIVVSAVLFIFITSYGHFGVYDILKWLYQGIVYALLILSLTAIVNMMTGNPIGTIVFTVGFALVPIVLIALLDTVFSGEVYGYFGRIDNFAQYLYIGEKGLLTKEYGFIYPILSIAFLLGAYLLYKFRKSERHSEVISFKFLVPLFIGIISSIASGMSFVYFSEFLGIHSIFTIIPFGVLGTLVAFMVYKKSVSLKGTLKPVAIYLVCILCFIGAVKFDLTGYERRLPPLSDIQSVSIEQIKYSSYDNVPEFTSEKDVQNVLKLHQHCIDIKEDSSRGFSDVYMPICYTLKNGKQILRKYTLNYETDEAFLKPLFETREYRISKFSLIDGKKRDFTQISISDRRFANGTYLTLYPDNEDMEKILSALKKDMSNATYEDLTQRRYVSPARISVLWNEEFKNENTDMEPKVESRSNSDTFSVCSSYINTIDILSKLGYYDAVPKVSDIASLTISVRSTMDDKEIVSCDMTDTQEISQIYSIYENMLSGKHYREYGQDTIDVYLTYTLNNSHVFDISCTYDREALPSELKKYLK